MNIRSMIFQRQAAIQRARELMIDPISQLPAPVRWAAWLTGTSDRLQNFLRGVLVKRVERLQQECVTLYEIGLLQVGQQTESDRP